LLEKKNSKQEQAHVIEISPNGLKIIRTLTSHLKNSITSPKMSVSAVVVKLQNITSLLSLWSKIMDTKDA